MGWETDSRDKLRLLNNYKLRQHDESSCFSTSVKNIRI